MQHTMQIMWGARATLTLIAFSFLVAMIVGLI